MSSLIAPDRPSYEMTASDGSKVTLTPVIPSDRPLFEIGVAGLSEESKFARFGQGVGGLTDKELDYLTHVDQRSHVAWGAVVDDQVAGVGRYIVAEGDDCAEVAVTVVDAMQRRGVGRALFTALAAVARADDVHEICFEAQGDNEAVTRLLAEVEVNPVPGQGLIERRLRLSDLPHTEDDAGLAAVMESVRS